MKSKLSDFSFSDVTKKITENRQIGEYRPPQRTLLVWKTTLCLWLLFNYLHIYLGFGEIKCSLLYHMFKVKLRGHKCLQILYFMIFNCCTVLFSGKECWCCDFIYFYFFHFCWNLHLGQNPKVVWTFRIVFPVIFFWGGYLLQYFWSN